MVAGTGSSANLGGGAADVNALLFSADGAALVKASEYFFGKVHTIKQRVLFVKWERVIVCYCTRTAVRELPAVVHTAIYQQDPTTILSA